MLILILLVFCAAAMGAGYFYTVSQEKKISDKEAAIENLEKVKAALKEDFDKLQEREQSVVSKNRDLRDAATKFDEQKKLILNQVRSSVAGFETFRVGATDEIARLKDSTAVLEAEKKETDEKLQSLEVVSAADKKRLTAEGEALTKKIGDLKAAESKLVQNLEMTDKSAMNIETAKLHYNLGNFYFKNGQHAAAAAEYKKALFYRPEDADANFNLAIVCDNFLEDRATAIFRFKRYLELKPKAADRKKILQRILDLELRDKAMADPPKKQDLLVFETGSKNNSKFNLRGDKG